MGKGEGGWGGGEGRGNGVMHTHTHNEESSCIIQCGVALPPHPRWQRCAGRRRHVWHEGGEGGSDSLFLCQEVVWVTFWYNHLGNFAIGGRISTL